MKPCSEACERNRDPILKVLKEWFLAPGVVLEIGAGTGQHAVYFAEHMPHVQWIATDCEENHAGIAAWIEEFALPNLRGPLRLEVSENAWPVVQANYVFSANTVHIMGWSEVQRMFAGIGRVLQPAGVFCLYGPFNRNGQFTSESNRAFDESLKAHDSKMGIRDDRALVALADDCGLKLSKDYSMPANNRVLVWTKKMG
jgi:cyclopropane fatty-acyl-phospholipid synthase-like methyltransferase